jgi:predicted phage-related endonuclease
MNVDTLAIAKRMAKGGFTAEQAETSAQIIGEHVDSELATKRDVKELDHKITQVEANLKRDIKESEVKLERSLAELHRHMLQMSVGSALMIVTVLGFPFRFLGR